MNNQVCVLLLLILSTSCSCLEVRTFEPLRHEGLSQSIAWCRDGLMSALQKSVSTLVAQNISPNSAAELKALYFQDRAALRRLEQSIDHDISRPKAPLVEARRAMQKQASPLDAVMSIMPVVSDILLAGPEDDPTQLSHANKLRGYTDRICRLSDIESQIQSLNQTTPYSCVLSDLIHSAVVCEAAKLDAGLYRMKEEDTYQDGPGDHTDGPGDHPDGLGSRTDGAGDHPDGPGGHPDGLNHHQNGLGGHSDVVFGHSDPDDYIVSDHCIDSDDLIELPLLPDDSMCIPAPQTLQSREDNLKYFHYKDENLKINLNLIDLSEGKLPQYIPEEIRQQEILTYLTLFRSNEIFSHISTLQHDHEKCVVNIIKSKHNNILPGWEPKIIYNSKQIPPMPPTNNLNSDDSDDDSDDTVDASAASAAASAAAAAASAGAASAASLQGAAVLSPTSPPVTTSTSTIPKPVEKKSVIIPMGLLFENENDRCHFAFNVRGSKTLHELSAVFSTAKRYPSSTGSFTSTGGWSDSIHAGVDEFVAALFPLLEEDLSSLMISNGCDCSSTKVMFFGHSFGAAITQVLSMKMSAYFGTLKDCPVCIDGVFFSPPRIFDRSQRTEFIHRVNSRVIIDINDGLHYLPCFEGNAQHGSVRCASRPKENIFHAAPHITHGRDYVVENFGLILLDVDYRGMSKTGVGLPSESYIVRKLRQTYPFLMTVVSALLPPKTLASLPSAMDFYAAHVCAPACALSAACIPLPGIGKPFRWWCESCLSPNLMSEVGI